MGNNNRRKRRDPRNNKLLAQWDNWLHNSHHWLDYEYSNTVDPADTGRFKAHDELSSHLSFDYR